ncbi:MAG: hypothetical protein KDK10_10825 [Maritimibacter sp.]|nr:hypothetical protein [Maritimibacter sp.]
MTVSASAGVPLPPGLRRLATRAGARPRLAPKWPCAQLDSLAPAALVEALAAAVGAFDGVRAVAAPFEAPGTGFSLSDDLARGQPEAFIGGGCFLVLAPGGAMHLSLRPDWAQKVVNHGWATVHPFARYMAGAVPPQSLVVYAPRDDRELGVVTHIAAAAHAYAIGRVGDIVLPDTRW